MIDGDTLPMHQFEYGSYFFNFHIQGGTLAFTSRQLVPNRFPLCISTPNGNLGQSPLYSQ